MWFGVITLFPECIATINSNGVVANAIADNKITIETFNPRDFANDKYRTVDDRPYGGGPGMVMKLEPMLGALHAAGEARTIYLTPQGKKISQSDIIELSKEDRVKLIAGRYAGIDERLFVLHPEIEQWSLADFILSGGELAALAIIDATARLVSGVLGNPDSAANDSFMHGLLDHPHYTRPENFAGKLVPEVLLSGDHAKIAKWREQQRYERTKLLRPDLIK